MKNSFLIVLGVLFYSVAAFASDGVYTEESAQSTTVTVSGVDGGAAAEIYDAIVASGVAPERDCAGSHVYSNSLFSGRFRFGDHQSSVEITVDHATSTVAIAKDDLGTVVTLEGQSAQDLFEVARAAGFSARLACGAQIVTGKHVDCTHFGPGSAYDCSIRLDN